LQEKKRIEEEDEQFLASLPSNSYVKWYLPVRKTISAVSTIAQYQTEKIPATFDFLPKYGLYRSTLSKKWIAS
jgi:hypothetical protein